MLGLMQPCDGMQPMHWIDAAPGFAASLVGVPGALRLVVQKHGATWEWRVEKFKEFKTRKIQNIGEHSYVEVYSLAKSRNGYATAEEAYREGRAVWLSMRRGIRRGFSTQND